jgi:hypothetical protein
MRFIIMHKTNANWEAGAIPSRELIARVGTLIGDLAKAKILLGAEGLRASSQGVRITFSGGTRTISDGPFVGDNELTAGFTILQVASMDEAIDWATRQAAVLGDREVDIRPVTEPWDIGLAPRPATRRTRRYMVLRKATAASEAGNVPSPAQRAEMTRLIDNATRTGAHIATATLKPSARGRRYKNARDGVAFTDGPFTESKELIAGYVLIASTSLDDAGRWAVRYIECVEADEVDLMEVEEP